MFEAVKTNSTLTEILIDVVDKVKAEIGWDGIFIKRSVTDLLYGYQDPILAKLHKYHKFVSFIPDENPIFALAVSKMGSGFTE